MKKILLLILCVFSFGCEKKEKFSKEEIINIELKTNEIELYNNYSIKDLIKNDNIEIINDKQIDTNKIGEVNYKLKYIYDNKKYITTITYNIVDNTKPSPISVPGILTVKRNDDFYPCENAVVADNYDVTVNCKIDGEYDLTTNGTYNVKYIFSDSSNNMIEKALQINVVENLNTTTNTQQNKKTYDIEWIKNNYLNNNTEIGIDVSRYQGDIDFNKVKEAGISFVIMRLGVQSNIDKDLSVDTFFEENYKKATEAGLKVGIYLYSTAINENDANNHAEWLLNVLNNRHLDFPIVFDWENWKSFNKYELTTHKLSEVFRTFQNKLKNNNYDAMLYSSKYYLENIWESFDNTETWLAHYTESTNYQGNYYIWQMCNTGRIPGINGDVDIDILYKKS